MNAQESIGVVCPRNMCSVCQTEIYVSGSRHEDVDGVAAGRSRILQFTLDHVCQNQSKILFFHAADADCVIAVRAANRAGAAMSGIDNNSSSRHSRYLLKDNPEVSLVILALLPDCHSQCVMRGWLGSHRNQIVSSLRNFSRPALSIV